MKVDTFQSLELLELQALVNVHFIELQFKQFKTLKGIYFHILHYESNNNTNAVTLYSSANSDKNKSEKRT